MIRWPGSICCHERYVIHHRSRHIDYAILKLIHVGCVAVSYTLFVLRGVWMLRASPLLQLRWVRTLPHVVDTLLLASALTMALMTGQYPFAAGWLTAKVIALVAYIGLGMTALRFGRSRPIRIAAWLLAQAVFFYIVAVALTRNPQPWMLG